jgi:hypothetical protein
MLRLMKKPPSVDMDDDATDLKRALGITAASATLDAADS